MIRISKADSKLPADATMPQQVDPQGGAPQVLEIMMTVLNMAHRQSDAVHPILGPKGDHPYMTEGACAVLDSWRIGECILQTDQEPAISETRQETIVENRFDLIGNLSLIHI